MSDKTIEQKLKDVSDNVEKVYQAGIEKGKAEGGDTTEAYNQGVQAEKERFAKAYTGYNEAAGEATRTDYQYAYSYGGWTNDTFYLPFEIKPKTAQNMFLNTHIKKIENVNFSGCEAFTNCFQNSLVEELCVIDSGANSAGYTFTGVFNGCKNLHTIEKWIPPKSNANYAYPFLNCTKLKNITIGGEIKKSISFGESSLLSTGAEGETTNSVQSIINALMNITDGTARAITFHADVRAKLTPEQVNTIKIVKGWSLIPE